MGPTNFFQFVQKIKNWKMSSRKAVTTPTLPTASSVSKSENLTVSSLITKTTASLPTTTTTETSPKISKNELENTEVKNRDEKEKFISKAIEAEKNEDKEEGKGNTETKPLEMTTEKSEKDIEEKSDNKSKEEAAAALKKEDEPAIVQKIETRAGSEAANSESDESASCGLNKLRAGLIRGRKSIKEAKEKEELKQKETDTLSPQKEEKDSKKILPKIKITTQSPVKETSEEKSLKQLDIKEETISKTDEEQIVKKETPSEAVAVESSSSPLPATCRLTRKSAAQELVSKIRVTRNRLTGRSGTPPIVSAAATAAALRSRRSVVRRKMTAGVVASTKRKRTMDDSVEQVSAKFIKTELKDDAVDVLEDEQLTPDAEADLMHIKLETAESDESMDVNNTTATATNVSTCSNQSLRGRTRGRKSQTPTIMGTTASPSTRTTRHTKLASQSPSPSPSSSSGAASEAKRRRTNATSSSSAVTRSSMSLLKSNQGKQTATVGQAADEDSKDSQQSSVDDMLLSQEQVKLEKCSNDLLDDELDFEAEEKPSTPTKGSALLDEELDAVSNGVSLPLTVDTAEDTAAVAAADAVDTADAAVLETTEQKPNLNVTKKEASLSPEMVSEGLSVISVKQFYKKPKFLENNLGIEEDPKLGEIVQKVSTESDAADEKPEQQATNNAQQDGCETTNGTAAATTLSEEEGFLSPLVVEEDETEEELVTVAKEVKVEAIAGTLTTNLVENVAQLDEEELEDDEEEGYCDRLIIHEDDVEDEDDGTVEESETNSMENNPSVNDEPVECERNSAEEADADIMDELEDFELDLQVESDTTMQNNNNTTHECENIVAKLETISQSSSVDKKTNKLLEETNTELAEETLTDIQPKKLELSSDENEIQPSIEIDLKQDKEQPEENKENLVKPEQMEVDEADVQSPKTFKRQLSKPAETKSLSKTKSKKDENGKDVKATNEDEEEKGVSKFFTTFFILCTRYAHIVHMRAERAFELSHNASENFMKTRATLRFTRNITL